MYHQPGPDQAESWLREARRAGLAWTVKTTRTVERTAYIEASTKAYKVVKVNR